ncbi:hypothetical protein NLM33_06235 [Bradyrhizobium sp. CCGUVB1N3]|uniref:hypothetical protein n=1 Tax=Bradyrhizobium sp. CCGUVB1N3 TaxID=2949629 RepID=UPI0020B2B655|nr:hypothetical protein [Bradyrhizobium sp. CCGUVB1N3]MCP3469926.1 hypothetical protein [Bradyrhizobium sp. CCGUVB1N3]
MGGIHSELAEKVDHALREVKAAVRDLTVTVFCLRQAEALRSIDRAKASLAHVLQLRNRENKKNAACD